MVGIEPHLFIPSLTLHSLQTVDDATNKTPAYKTFPGAREIVRGKKPCYAGGVWVRIIQRREPLPPPSPSNLYSEVTFSHNDTVCGIITSVDSCEVCLSMYVLMLYRNYETQNSQYRNKSSSGLQVYGSVRPNPNFEGPGSLSLSQASTFSFGTPMAWISLIYV
ncbi:hypothetical protein LZ31DRAFT_354770 [Colletotrichum somersetense]|nr:hypothetical protein LZ31DRAFT_354770 [Colletotrichum somersetense]